MDITEKYRPKELFGVIGQTTAINQIKRIIDSRGLAGSCWWISGPSGSGKTFSSLKLARGLVGPTGKIAFIDTENGSGKLYADLTEFITLTFNRRLITRSSLAQSRKPRKQGSIV